jgi:hypothetical protein
MDDMEYNGGHQQRVLKITRGEYSVQSTQYKFGPVCDKMLCERKKFFNYAGIYIQIIA